MRLTRPSVGRVTRTMRALLRCGAPVQSGTRQGWCTRMVGHPGYCVDRTLTSSGQR